MNKVSILVISISNPILIGIYDESNLIEKISLDGKTSDALPKAFENILNRYNLKTIFYVNGPGSYMSIKVSYIFLKTLAIVKHLDFRATNGFHFNEGTAIKALGKKYFLKDLDDKITIDFLEQNDIKDFKLPNSIDDSIFTKDTLPNYNLPAV